MNQMVSLAEILTAREQRAKRQKRLAAAFPDTTILSITVNMAGSVKYTETVNRVFECGCLALVNALQISRIPVMHIEKIKQETGCEALIVVDSNSLRVKTIACELEEGLRYGRLLDIDVIDEKRLPVRRELAGFSVRGCMVCGRQGAICASRRLHPVQEIVDVFERIAGCCQEE
ncbi:MAG: citrate lyase holo-[acyl-carrier protein] synthase [Clostridia bacterium]